MTWFLSFLFAFVTMEWVAYWLHKYVMHGFLWWVHEDHHIPPKDSKFQKNDAFAFFFAFPSFFLILFGSLYSDAVLSGLGFGIMAYGVAYFVVHEVIIHRRWKFFRFDKSRYAQLVILAHRNHHRVRTKEGAADFGMLWVPLSDWRSATTRFPRALKGQKDNKSPSVGDRSPSHVSSSSSASHLENI